MTLPRWKKSARAESFPVPLKRAPVFRKIDVILYHLDLACVATAVTADWRIREDSRNNCRSIYSFFHYQFLRQATDGDEKTTNALPPGKHGLRSEESPQSHVSPRGLGGSQALDDPYIGRNVAARVSISSA
jgi:hypothetical protein